MGELERRLVAWSVDGGGEPPSWAAVVAEYIDELEREVARLKAAKDECERQFQEKVAEIAALI